MQKSYTVKNATFIFDDRVRFKGKTYNYNPETCDQFEASKEFTDDIDHCDKKESEISGILFLGAALLTAVYVIFKYLLNIIIMPEFVYFLIMVTFVLSGYFLLMLSRRSLLDAGDFYEQTAPIEAVVNFVKDADKIKRFEVLTYSSKERKPMLYIEFEDGTDITSSYDDSFKDYKFDEKSYRKNASIEINMIDKTIKCLD